jgi:hypothetical protein
MAVRNFWVDGDVDGRETALSGGPRAKNGGMSIKILQRDNGNIVTAYKIYCGVSPDGKKLTSCVYDGLGNLVQKFETER